MGFLMNYINTKNIDISLKNEKELRKLCAKEKKIEEKSYNNEQHFQNLLMENNHFTFTASVCKEMMW